MNSVKQYIITALIVAATAMPSGAQRKSAAAETANAPATYAGALSHFKNYDFDEAEAALERYAAMKNASEQLAEALGKKITLGRSMLERVEKIAVIDSFTVDKHTFFERFNLNPSAGRLSSVKSLPDGFAADTATVVYSTEGDDRMLWGAPGKNGKVRIMESSLLADGTWETPAALDESVNINGSRSNYPFVMTDGVTLYFASDAPEASLGGYDIFITRFDGEKYLEPQNVGMPYNSTADDYMLAVDETTGAGWWATDRNHIAGKVTIYVYVPEELRVNYPMDTPGLTSLALLRDISATQADGKDYSKLRERIRTPFGNERKQVKEFEFAMPDGRVITSIGQLSSESARYAMESYLDKYDELNAHLLELNELRQQYAEGNKELAQQILKAEKTELQLRNDLRRLSNLAVNAEMRSNNPNH